MVRCYDCGKKVGENEFVRRNIRVNRWMRRVNFCYDCNRKYNDRIKLGNKVTLGCVISIPVVILLIIFAPYMLPILLLAGIGYLLYKKSKSKKKHTA